jgi:hypothetical protein
MSEPIPPDVFATATLWAGKHVAGRFENFTDCLAQAILAEREAQKERDAKIADRLVMLPADECNVPFNEIEDATMRGRRDCATQIAAAIRNPHAS